jgi:hypothetical protein
MSGIVPSKIRPKTTDQAEGDFVGEWLYIYFNYGAKYLKKALEIYRKGE